MRRFVLGLFAAIGIVASLTVLGAGALVWYLRRAPAASARQHRGDGRSEPRAGGGGEPGRAEPDRVRRQADAARFSRRARTRRRRQARQGALCPARPGRAGRWRRRRKSATRSGRSAPRASSRSPLPRVSASSAPARGRIISPPPLTKSGCSRLGSVGLIGLRAEMPFFRGTLDWLGIKPSLRPPRGIQDAPRTASPKPR